MPSVAGDKRRIVDPHMMRRLKDQAAVVKKALEIHENPRLLREIAFYPAHDKRKETPRYNAIHRSLTIEKDLPCMICGVRHSTLADRTENPYRAKAMETHHHVIEWALANAVDLTKFNKTILPHLAERHPQQQDYQKPFTQQQLLDWVDHSPDNLWVLCDVHHRAQYVGVHEISYPIWGPQHLLHPDFLEQVKRQLAAINAKTKPKAKAKSRAKPKKRG
ncbi:MAG TPA: hypothetical protein VK745_16930 [Polyangiaceae bacterium]|jgi:hypothetical protein|nr:hypothetical protein [Polyangiaceae bacterium]